MKVKEKSGKDGLKLHIHKTKITPSDPVTLWQIGKKSGNSFSFGGAPKLLQTVTAAMKLKDACSLEGKLRQT